MLGSLVVIYPTAHEGGELVLRHGDHEWKFDANSLTASQSSPSLAYVAFYSDLEHEVLEVTSGRQVTVTYNLYQSTLRRTWKLPSSLQIPKGSLTFKPRSRVRSRARNSYPMAGHWALVSLTSTPSPSTRNFGS